MRPGRKSTANVLSLTTTTPRTVLIPIGPPLTTDERLFFDHVARCNHHLRPIDVPNLMLYVAAVVRSLKARSRHDETFEKEARTALAIARSLRLTPQSTTEPKTAGRRRDEAPRSYYDIMREER